MTLYVQGFDMHFRRTGLNRAKVLRVLSDRDIRVAANGHRIGLCIKCGHEHGFIPTYAAHWYCEVCGDYSLYSARKLQKLIRKGSRQPRATAVFQKALSVLSRLVKLRLE